MKQDLSSLPHGHSCRGFSHSSHLGALKWQGLREAHPQLHTPWARARPEASVPGGRPGNAAHWCAQEGDAVCPGEQLFAMSGV